MPCCSRRKLLEGVDVKGKALRSWPSTAAVRRADDPLLKARLEGIRRRGGNPFSEYQLPQAVLALKQGVGRLIRDFDDFGVIVLGDPRSPPRGMEGYFCRRFPKSRHHRLCSGAQFLAERLSRARAVMTAT